MAWRLQLGKWFLLDVRNQTAESSGVGIKAKHLIKDAVDGTVLMYSLIGQRVLQCCPLRRIYITLGEVDRTLPRILVNLGIAEPGGFWSSRAKILPWPEQGFSNKAASNCFRLYPRCLQTI